MPHTNIKLIESICCMCICWVSHWDILVQIWAL